MVQGRFLPMVHDTVLCKRRGDELLCPANNLGIIEARLPLGVIKSQAKP